MSEPLTLAELDTLRDDCRRIVLRRATLSGAIAAVPLPMLDAAADLGILMRTLPRISAEFGLSTREIERLDPESQAVVYAAIKSVGETLVGQVITQQVLVKLLQKVGVRFASKQATKLAPVVGQAASASISFALMRQIGFRHIDDCYRISRRRAEKHLFGKNAVVIDHLA